MALTEALNPTRTASGGTVSSSMSRLLTRLWDSNPRYRQTQALAQLGPEQMTEHGTSRKQTLCRISAINLRV